jgi:beta-glucosidase
VTYQGPDGNWVGPPSGAPNWLFKTPDALRHTLVWLHKRYEGPEFWITENGVAGLNESTIRPPAVLQDDYRLGYYR